MNSEIRYTGLFAAAFSPMQEDGSLNLTQIPHIVDYLIEAGISGLYICGATGEGPSLSSEERRAVAEAYIKATAGRLTTIVQIGHNSLAEVRDLASHAESIGADAISVMPPLCYKFNSVKTLIDCLAHISDAAPTMPLFYYHIPSLTGMSFDMVEFLREGGRRIPHLAGIKYTHSALEEYQTCLQIENQRFSVLFGRDEMLLAALAVGAKGAIGTTYNLAGPLYRKVLVAFERADLDEARQYHSLAVEMIRICLRYGGLPAFKAVMKLIGLDCGPNRLPLETLALNEVESLKKNLDDIGFFEWALPEKQPAD
ncbi:MAG: dihydrodipicolinate synthase family protein [Sedimentisphaerales bacterium]|nr:dihydrodipicolinate synthase family protein [Sedimentisphaerales bacterium]